MRLAQNRPLLRLVQNRFLIRLFQLHPQHLSNPPLEPPTRVLPGSQRHQARIRLALLVNQDHHIQQRKLPQAMRSLQRLCLPH
jgi:hypothetical protein